MKILFNNHSLSEQKFSNEVSMTGQNIMQKTSSQKIERITQSKMQKLYKTASKMASSIQDFIFPNVKHFYDENNNLIRIEKYNYQNDKIMGKKAEKFKFKQYYENGKVKLKELYDSKYNTLREKHIYNPNEADFEKSFYYRKGGSLEKKKLNSFHYCKVINYNEDGSINDISVFDHYKKGELVDYKSPIEQARVVVTADNSVGVS